MTRTVSLEFCILIHDVFWELWISMHGCISGNYLSPRMYFLELCISIQEDVFLRIMLFHVRMYFGNSEFQYMDVFLAIIYLQGCFYENSAFPSRKMYFWELSCSMSGCISRHYLYCLIFQATNTHTSYKHYQMYTDHQPGN